MTTTAEATAEARPHLVALDILDTVRGGALVLDMDNAPAVLARIEELEGMADTIRQEGRRFMQPSAWPQYSPELARADELRNAARRLARYAHDAGLVAMCEDCCERVARDECDEFPGMVELDRHGCAVYHLCEDCARTCDECNTYMSGGDTYELGGACLCGECHEDLSRYCSRCDESFHRDSEEWSGGANGRCAECHQEEQEEQEEAAGWPILEYHSQERRRDTRKVRDEWTCRTGRFFGVELEVEHQGGRATFTRDEVARAVLDVANGDATGNMRKLFLERDGSLVSGFEMITQPMSLPAHRELWGRVLSLESVRGSLLSHDTTTCGLHVHVNRASVSALTVAKAVVFLNDNRSEGLVRAIARRYGGGYAVAGPKKLGRGAAYGINRYDMVNTSRTDTVEFRLFRGSTRAATVLACIEFAHAVLNWCAVESCQGLTVDNFLAWLYRPENGGQDTHNLRRYLEHLPASFRTRWTLTATIEKHARRACTVDTNTTGDN